MSQTLNQNGTASADFARSPRARVVRLVHEWINSGALRPGDFLPSERKLADQLGVARLTARFALIDLQRSGLIETIGRKRRLVRRDGNPTLAKTVVLISTARYTPAVGWESSVQMQAEEHLQRAGFNPLLFNPIAASEERLYDLLREQPAGFMVFADAAENPAVQRFAGEALAARKPLVVQSGEEHFADAIRVTSDHDAGAYELTRWMIQQGCRRILRFWARDVKTEWLVRRNRGVERALTEAGLPVLPEILASVTDRRGEELPDQHYFSSRSRQMLGFLFEHLKGPEPVDGILVLSDPDALSVAAACRIAGVVPGRDLLIGGYDNCWNICPEYFFEKTAPAVTVDKRNDLIGVTMAEQFLRETEQDHTPKLIMVPHRLVPIATEGLPPERR